MLTSSRILQKRDTFVYHSLERGGYIRPSSVEGKARKGGGGWVHRIKSAPPSLPFDFAPEEKRHSPKTPPPLHPQPLALNQIFLGKGSHTQTCAWERSLAGSFCVPIAFAGNLVTLMNSKSISTVRRRQTRLWVVTAILLGKYPGECYPAERKKILPCLVAVYAGRSQLGIACQLLCIFGDSN
ncbi:hypothetical protein CDAR_42141 [Caerostris darwini]|uniref:Uncharacterized protein n=1 Tax=Caerostris darwini TaxID=1538125 RepID=A0AAV4RFF9_9ARAC|nr:hypothetical protein CDAR_42141 [Caerostris darwini]